MQISIKKKTCKVLGVIGKLIVVFIFLVPLWMVLVNSLKTRRVANRFGMGLPEVFEWSNYLQVWEEGKILRAFGNDLIVSCIATFLTLLLSSMAAFVIARSSRKSIKKAYYLFLTGLVVPIAFIPTYLVLQKLNLLNTYLGLILVHVTYGIPGSLFLYVGFIKALPRSLDEAAIIDGCNPMQLFLKIILPLLQPITITLLIFNFVGTWNDSQMCLFFTNSDKWTLPMSLYSFYGAKSSSWNLVFADIVLTVLPLLVLYLFGQKYIIEGMTAGAVKG